MHDKFQIEMAKVMNGIRGNSNEVKYPVNCASRVKTPAFTGSGSMSEAELDDLYEPKPDKKVVRVVTVIAYMFSVSLGMLFKSIIKSMKNWGKIIIKK